ncbi:MAG: AAA family ATPase [Polyangiales bacterium]
MRLRSISIKNFRGIDTLEFELPPDDGPHAGALVLAGDNGVGKTSVLEAILILFGRVDLLPADTASPRELVRQGAVDFEIRGELAAGGRAEPWSVNRAELEALNARLRRPDAESAYGKALKRDSLDDTLRGLQWGGLGPSHFAIEYFSARREPVDLGDPPSGTSGPRSTREERRLAELKRRLVNVFTRSRGRDETFERIEAFMRTFFGPRWTLDVMFRSAEVGGDAEVVVRDGPLPSATLTIDAVRERAAYGEAMPRVVPIDRLSSGQLAVLAMAYPFVFADRAPDLALIDEPEQHHQVGWQGALLPALRALSPATQFVVATHSPWVLDAVPSYERRELTADDIQAPPVADAAE